MRDSSLEVLLLLATLFVAHGRYAKALTLLEGLREIRDSDERILRPLCYCLVMEKHYPEALETIQALYAFRSSLSEEDRLCLLRLKALALWGQGQADQARTVLEQSMALGAKNQTAEMAGPVKQSWLERFSRSSSVK
ncbi:hypothetical protein LJB81_03050 [Desulfovibrio sp. OttesenSCG-928-M14]|nr:hypothetical protein [Desulfovibrio sp. OttesenSCG-928-M14]